MARLPESASVSEFDFGVTSGKIDAHGAMSLQRPRVNTVRWRRLKRSSRRETWPTHHVAGRCVEMMTLVRNRLTTVYGLARLVPHADDAAATLRG